MRVRVPRPSDARVAFLADIENLPLRLEAPAARIVLNARTGSVVMNDAVTLGACAVAHGNLSVTISSTPVISQPNALGQGQTVAGAEVRHLDHASKAARWCRWPPAPGWPTWSRR